MSRTAHYVASTHWDREWYEPFQGFRFRLLSLLDEVFATLDRDPSFRCFVMDGQSIPIVDFLEIYPQQAERIRGYVTSGRLKLGPWYVMPDEFLVSGESLIRNLEHGMAVARQFGETSHAGFVCDIFGHISQLPQIFRQSGINAGFIWRGTHEKEHGGTFLWQGADGTALPCYRFGHHGYPDLAFLVHNPLDQAEQFSVDQATEKLVAYALNQAKRCPTGPILLFDGGDHLEIIPQMSAVLAKAKPRLAEQGIDLVHSDLDAFAAELNKAASGLRVALRGELRESGRDPNAVDEQWLIPGVLSSRIHLKQQNAACEDELCLWAEPFSAFAHGLGHHYPEDFLRVAWRHLLENHPHDSICGCSIDQVHQDMVYRFDQSLGIATRLTKQALSAIALASTPKTRADGALVVSVFNATAEDIDEPVDLDIALPAQWAKRFNEFFGYEEKFAFRIRDAAGGEVPWQLVGQKRDRISFKRARVKFPVGDIRHVLSVCAPLSVPAFGWTTLVIEPVDGPTRHLGSMASSHRAIENEALCVVVNGNGTLAITDKRSGRTFDQALTFEQCADIGDGWFHGMAVNDQIFTSAAANAEVVVIADGFAKATMRVIVTMNVPEEFDFRLMARSTRVVPLRMTAEVTLRRGGDRVEISCQVDNNARDHRLRVLFPTGLAGDTMLSDGAFDVLERPVALAADNAIRRELDVETRPQQCWTAFSDGKHGLAVVSRGLPECAVRATPDRPIALTLLRAFRRAVFANDIPGGQIQGSHRFRFDLVPFSGPVPVRRLALLGQRMLGAVRAVDLLPEQIDGAHCARLPMTGSFLRVEGDAVVSSVRRQGSLTQLRLFNPSDEKTRVTISGSGKNVALRAMTIAGEPDPVVRIAGNTADIPGKHIATLALTEK